MVFEQELQGKPDLAVPRRTILGRCLPGESTGSDLKIASGCTLLQLIFAC
jgi:hypothetical protein